MAVDTRDKRFSMMGLLQPVPSVLPNPDGTVNTQDRAQYLFLYHGIALGGAVIEEVITGGMLAAKNVRRSMRRFRSGYR